MAWYFDKHRDKFTFYLTVNKFQNGIVLFIGCRVTKPVIHVLPLRNVFLKSPLQFAKMAYI